MVPDGPSGKRTRCHPNRDQTCVEQRRSLRDGVFVQKGSACDSRKPPDTELRHVPASELRHLCNSLHQFAQQTVCSSQEDGAVQLCRRSDCLGQSPESTFLLFSPVPGRITSRQLMRWPRKMCTIRYKLSVVMYHA